MAKNTKKKSKNNFFSQYILFFFHKYIHMIFRKDDKQERKFETKKKELGTKVTSIITPPSTRFREQLKQEEKRETYEKKFIIVEIEDNPEEAKKNRSEFRSSINSGFIDKKGEEQTKILLRLQSNKIEENKRRTTDKSKNQKENKTCDDVTESLKNPKLCKAKDKKNKKIVTTTITRGPIGNKNFTSRSQVHPYAGQSSQVTNNYQTFRGDQDKEDDIFHKALDDLFSSSRNNEEENFNIIPEFFKTQYQGYANIPNVHSEGEPANILTSSNHQPPNTITSLPEPPGSVNSLLSNLQLSPRAHTSSSDYMFSPSDTSLPVLNSYKTQKIPQLTCQSRQIEQKTLQWFKSKQEEISASFCIMECCQNNRKSCKDIFNERLGKFNAEERNNILLNVGRLDLKAAFSLLVQILRSIAKGSDSEDLEYVIFALVCQRVLDERPTWFLEEFGASLIEYAVQDCYKHSVLTRYLVHCVRTVNRSQNLETLLFPIKLNSKGDNLVITCALNGDAFANVLYWLVAREPHELPLFDLGHCNIEGNTALLVACQGHSATHPRLHTVHVLLQHGGADLWKGKLTSGDTPLHLAVSSPTCDLQLVLLLFHHTEERHWKQLATRKNWKSATPAELALGPSDWLRKPNFPREVFEFIQILQK